MNDAKLYHANNFLQKRDACDLLEDYVDKIKWRNKGARIIDIGSGDGSVTVHLLKKYIPDNFEKLLGCDINENMVKFANDHHKSDKIMFSVLDIEGNLPENMKRKFDNAFSFYTLHWIMKQETAFRNIFDLITDGGDCLLMFLAYNPAYTAYRILAQNNKWSSWLQDVEGFISPYCDSQEPEKEVRTIMTKVGFSDIVVKCQEKNYIYDSPDAMKNSIGAVNPFKMPKKVLDDFMEDYLQVVRDRKLIYEASNNKTGSVTTPYKLITVYGIK